jgi:hypothetical protein
MSNEINLRLVAHLDDLTDQELGYFEKNEGSSDWVDVDRPRDDAWSITVKQRADKYGVADDNEVLAEFPTFAEANAALHKASGEMANALQNLRSKVKRSTAEFA